MPFIDQLSGLYYIVFVNLDSKCRKPDLDDPADVVGVHPVLDGPLGQLVPLVQAAAVDGEAQLRVLYTVVFFRVTPSGY